MGSSPSSSISPPLREALAAAAEPDGFIRFDRFMHTALYHPEEGYYQRKQRRVGRSTEADFFTASSLGPVFGELVVASCVHQLGGRAAADYQFIEIGAENGQTILDGIEHPFGAVTAIGPNDRAKVTGRCIVFSNELFDAQPCRRFRGTAEGWQELGVLINGDSVVETSRRLANRPPELPNEVVEGYELDLPLAARELTSQLARQDWTGLFLAFDYGKSWRELSEETPQGTVRAYHQHRQTNSLYERIGEQDLTCHICWDWLSDSLRKEGFLAAPVTSQEAFLVKNAAKALAKIMTEEATRVSERKTGLLQLLHPSALGQKFQVLSAQRNDL